MRSAPARLLRALVILMIASACTAPATETARLAPDPSQDDSVVAVLIARDPILAGTSVTDVLVDIDAWFDEQVIAAADAEPDSLTVTELAQFDRFARAVDAGDQLTLADVEADAAEAVTLPTMTLDDLRNDPSMVIGDAEFDANAETAPPASSAESALSELLESQLAAETVTLTVVREIPAGLTVGELRAAPSDWLATRRIPTEFVAPQAILSVFELDGLEDEVFERTVLVGEQFTWALISGDHGSQAPSGLALNPGALPPAPAGQSTVLIVAQPIAAGQPVAELTSRRFVTARFIDVEFLEPTAITQLHELAEFDFVRTDLEVGEQLLIGHLVPASGS